VDPPPQTRRPEAWQRPRAELDLTDAPSCAEPLQPARHLLLTTLAVPDPSGKPDQTKSLGTGRSLPAVVASLQVMGATPTAQLGWRERPRQEG